VIDPLVVAFGLGVGILIGLTGIGGGSSMTPLLVLVVGVQPVVAIGTDLAYGAITKTVGGWRHLRSGAVDRGVSKWLAVGSVPGAITGVLAVDALHNRYGYGFDSTLLGLVAVALLFVALSVLARALFGVPREQHSVPMRGQVKAIAVAIGLAIGVVLGMTSVGSGALVGLALIVVFRLTPHRVVGTDLPCRAHALGRRPGAFGRGQRRPGAGGELLAGSLPGVWLGSALMPYVPARTLRLALGCTLLGSALAVMTKAGVDVPTWTIIAIPALVGVLTVVVQRPRRPESGTAWSHASAHPEAEAIVGERGVS
jgi:uncharacterized membrane protein YfcA